MIPAYKVRFALEELGYEIEHIQLATQNPTRNLVFRVLTPNHDLCCKIYRDDPWGYFRFDQHRLDAKLALMKHLSSTIPVIKRPITSVVTTEFGPCLFWQWEPIFHEKKEQRPEYDLIFKEKPWLYHFGQLLAQIHQKAQSYKGPKYQDQPYFRKLPAFFAGIQSANFQDALQNLSTASKEVLRSLGIQWLEEFEKKDVSWLPPTWIHGDVHFNNMRFNIQRKKVEYFIDWDATRQATRLLDLIEVLQRCSIGRKDFFAAKEIIRGYVSVAPLTEQERQLFRLVILGMNIRREAYMVGSGGFPDTLASTKFALKERDQQLVKLVL